MELEIITASDYVHFFGISKNTALVWYADDCCMLGRKRLTRVQFEIIYMSVEPLKGVNDSFRFQRVSRGVNEQKKPKKVQKSPNRIKKA